VAYHDDLLQQAFDLVHKDPVQPTQASLRRSVSAAYYSLFHLLISETVANWSLDSSRDALGRMFEHSAMKRASVRIRDSKLSSFSGEDPAVIENLKIVAQSFGRLQDRRHVADYDNGHFWSHTEALSEVTIAAKAFSVWRLIQREKIAQDFLVSLLIKPRD
jgi:hypothetical protein